MSYIQLLIVVLGFDTKWYKPKGKMNPWKPACSGKVPKNLYTHGQVYT